MIIGTAETQVENKVLNVEENGPSNKEVNCVECGSVTLLSLVLSIRVMLKVLVETTACY
jgi:hypothetical protein